VRVNLERATHEVSGNIVKAYSQQESDLFARLLRARLLVSHFTGLIVTAVIAPAAA